MVTFLFAWGAAGPSHGALKVVYKEARPKKALTKERAREAKDTYAGKDLPDPFVSYLVRREQVLSDLEEARKRRLTALERLKVMQEAKTALQKLELAQLKITAIIKGKQSAWAMVKDASGMGYVVKKGTYIGTKGGVVENILRETKTDELGSRRVVRKILIREPYINDEGVIDYKLVEMEMAESSYD